jgi:4'-phosphopantetheinyl transferase EntD
VHATEPVPRPRSHGLIASVLPAAAVAAESFGPVPALGPPLPPAEERAMRTAGPRRRAEFAAARWCARTALAGLGMAGAEIPPGPAGEPRWPAGVAGSITHCRGYRACAVARAADVAAIGIDAEPDERLPAGLAETVTTAAERARIGRLAASAPAVCWERLVFSAKEAACKLWYPLTGCWPGPGGLAVSGAMDAADAGGAAGSFTVRLPDAGPAPAGMPRTLAGRWLARGGLIVTAIAWSPAGPGAPAGRAAPARPAGR